MKKYSIKVEIVKEYEIEIDETKLTEEELSGWEKVFWKLDEEDDKYKSMAHDFCRLRAIQGEGFIEGFGCVLEYGEKPFSVLMGNKECNDAINLTMIDEDNDPYVDVEEIN